jgi:hypothetical protein
MIAVPSSHAVVEADDGGKLTVACRVLQDGVPYPGAVTPTVSFSPSEGVSSENGSYSFAKFGAFKVLCSAEVEGQQLSAEADIAVLNEAIDPAIAKLGGGASKLQEALFALQAAHNGPDEKTVNAVLMLDDALADLDAKNYLDFTDALRKLPPGGYPDAAELEAQGIVANADDALLGDKLTALGSAFAELKTGYDSMSDTVAMADLTALDQKQAAVKKAADELLALKPTAHGYLATRTTLADVLRDGLAPALHAMASKTKAVVQSEAATLFEGKAGPPQQGARGSRQQLYFGFIGFTFGFFGSGSLQMTLVNKIYGKYIQELDVSINNLILINLIDYFFPPDPQGPVIDFLFASASAGFAVVGYDSSLDGYNFNSDPTANMILVVGQASQTVVESIFSACGIDEADTAPEAIDTLANCIEDVIAAVESSIIYPTSVSPGEDADQHLELGPFPAACSGTLSKPIGLIPINLAVGRGPTHLVNCIGN